MEGMRAYQSFMALKLHFTSDYDYFKYAGKTRSISEQSFQARKDHFKFQKLERRYKDKIEDFFVANFVLNPNAKWIGDFDTMQADKLFREWQKTEQSFSYTMGKELSSLNAHPKSLFKVEDGKHPEFLRAYLSRKISTPTFVACDEVISFMDKWNEKISDDHIWPEVRTRIEKYRPFFRRLNFSKKQLAGIISNAFDL